MRVVDTKKIEEEKYITCPNCKRLLAYTDLDIREVIKHDTTNKLFKVSKYIDCIACKYSNLLSSEDFHYYKYKE